MKIKKQQLLCRCFFVSGLRVLVLLGQLKHSRVDNEQATILAEELSNGGILYKKEVYFNIFVRLPNWILMFIPIWMLIKHIDDFKDIEDCDAIVVSGKKMIRYAKHLRRNAFPKTKIVQIGNPYCSMRRTDILLRQNTSRYLMTGKNTIKCNGLICRKVNEKLSIAEGERFAKIKSYLHGEFIGVFIGGDRFTYKLNIHDAVEFAKTISRISYNMKMPLLIATDKGVSNKIVSVIKENLDCSYYFYNRNTNPDENPKVAFMHWASFYILIGNSINDHSEYLSQDKPSYIYLCKNNTKRYLEFVNSSLSDQCVRLLTSDMERLEYYQPKELNDIMDISNKIKDLL